MKDNYNKTFGDKEKIMFIFAHPDDAEVYAGGTIARLAKDKKGIRLVSVTNGDKGSRDNKITQQELANQRKKEDLATLRHYGLNDNAKVFLNEIDGEVENNLKLIEKIVYQIREFKPDIVVTHNPEDKIIKHDSGFSWVNHRDHLHTGLSVVDAVYPYSRDMLFFPEQLKTLTSHTCTKLLFVDSFKGEDIVSIDITDFIDSRIKALSAHASQFSAEKALENTEFMTKMPGMIGNFERFSLVEID